MEDIDAISEFFTFGFVLGDKTLLINHKIPEIAINYRIEKTQTSWQDVYSALESSVIESCQNATNPCMLLSGGMDSRIIAGIIADNKFDIPFYTIGLLPKEIIVSKAISETLRLRHFIIPKADEQELFDFCTLRDIAFHTLGTLSMPYFLWRSFALRRISKKERIHAFITGLYGTELLAESITRQSKSLNDFCTRLYRSRYQIQTLEKKYHLRALSNLMKYCKGLDMRSLYYETYIKSRARTETWTLDKKPIVSPFLNSDVLSSIFSLPAEMRLYKRINNLIIKHKFPKLASIPDITVAPKKKILVYIKKKIRKALSLRIKEVIDFDSLFRNNPDLKEYIRCGIPSLSNEIICEKIIDNFYNKNMDISKPMSYYISYFFIKDKMQMDG